MGCAAVAGVLAAFLLLAGCGSEPGQAPTDPPAAQETTVNPSTPPPTPDPGTPSAGQGPIEQAKSDLAQRLGIAPDRVTLVSAEEVTWPDGSLGCPQKGMRYTQALVNGSRIVLSADGKQYHYHSGGRRGPFLCTNPQPPVPGGG